MAWLVTGGAGYIGSHVVRAFRDEQIETVVIDDLSSGHASFVPDGTPFYQGSILDEDLLRRVFSESAIEGVVHVAGYKYAGVSVQRPLHTFEQNVGGTLCVLRAMREAGVKSMIFSSSAAVYGTPDGDLVVEDSPKKPESPYGESKLVAEWLIRDEAVASDVRYTCLRYFNVVGSGDPSLPDTSPHNLFPLIFAALDRGTTPRINGDDYSTPDGTCVRDYVHVSDLALSHVAAAKRALRGEKLEAAYNLGSGTGASLREIMATVSAVTGTTFTPVIGPRRDGDPAQIVASGDLARRDLNWEMRHSLADMVRSAWQARGALPEEI